MHILLIGTDRETRELLAAILRYCGAFVSAITTLAEALEIMKRIKADVLVIQLDPTKSEAGAIVQQIRALKPESGGVVPTVAVQPRSTESGADALRAAGFGASVEMPVDPWALCRLVANLASRT